MAVHSGASFDDRYFPTRSFESVRDVLRSTKDGFTYIRQRSEIAVPLLLLAVMSTFVINAGGIGFSAAVAAILFIRRHPPVSAIVRGQVTG